MNRSSATCLTLCLLMVLPCVVPGAGRTDLDRTAGIERYRRLASLTSQLDAGEIVDLLAQSDQTNGTYSIERYLIGSALLAKLKSQGCPDKNKALQAVQSLGNDPDWKVRMTAAELLGMLESEQALPMLEALSRDEIWSVRAHAIKALTHVPGDKALTILDRILATTTIGTLSDRTAVIDGMIKRKNISALIRGLSDPAPKLRLRAAEGIGTFVPVPAEALAAIKQAQRRFRDQDLLKEIHILEKRDRKDRP